MPGELSDFRFEICERTEGRVRRIPIHGSRSLGLRMRLFYRNSSSLYGLRYGHFPELSRAFAVQVIEPTLMRLLECGNFV
jgi:hypothetical protein